MLISISLLKFARLGKGKKKAILYCNYLSSCKYFYLLCSLLWWGRFCAGWVSVLHKRRKNVNLWAPCSATAPCFCLPSICYRKALYKPVVFSLIQTVFTLAKHNLELSFYLIVFLEPSYICNYMQFYSVICSSLSAVCAASHEKTPTDNLFPGISCLKRGSLLLWRWPGKQSPSRNKYTPASPLFLLWLQRTWQMSWIRELFHMTETMWEMIFCPYLPPYGAVAGLGRAKALETEAWSWGDALE